MNTAPCETLAGERVGTSRLNPAIPGVFQPLPLSSIDATWRTSEHGRYFRHQQLRYTNRYQIPEVAALEHLGPDTCPQGHQDEFVQYIDLVLDEETRLGTTLAVSDEDRALLFFVAKFHDIGELTHPELIEHGLKPVGDIPFGRKTDEDRAEESRVRTFLFSCPPFCDIDPEFLGRAEAIIAHDHDALRAFTDSTEHLHEIYEAAHDLQSVDTALRARFAVEYGTEEIQPELRHEFQRLAENVLRDHIERLTLHYPYLAAVGKAVQLSNLPSHFVTENNRAMHEACAPRTLRPLGSCVRTCVRLQNK